MKIVYLMILLSAFLMAGCEYHADNNITETIKQAVHFRAAQEAEGEIGKRHTVYVPAYSHVYTSKDQREVMGITLSIRNTDFTNSLWVEKILYYNTEGDLVETFLSSPHVLAPMSSIDMVVDLTDMRGGSGANFIVEWGSKKELTDPVIHAVMVQVSGTRAFAFAVDGVVVK